MKILYLNHNVAWSGGTFLRAYPYAKELAALGHDVTLLTISPTRRLVAVSNRHDGVRVIETPDLLWGRGRSGWDPWDVVNRLAMLRNERHWDVIHSWDCRPVAILPALWAHARARDAKLLTDWADWWGRGGTQGERQGGWMRAIWPLETFFEERFRPRADATTVISTPLRDRATALGIPASRVHLLPQGCAPPTDLSRDDARRRLGISGDARLLLYVGRLIRSDAALLFAVVDRLLARRADVRFVMVGNHGAIIPPSLLAHARFSVMGVVSSPTLADYTAACDLAVVPLADTLASRARWPSKINGLLSAGRVVVTTSVGDFPAWLAREGAAIVTAPSADGMVEAIAELLEAPDRRRHVEDAARSLAAGALSWPRLAAGLDGIYRSL